MKKLIISILALFLAVLGGSQLKLGGTAGNLPADRATSSTVAVGPAVVVLFPASPSNRLCASRTVNVVDALWIGFSNTATNTLQSLGIGGVVPPAAYLVAASSTASFKAEDYGCEAWIARSANGSASSTIGITEFKQ